MSSPAGESPDPASQVPRTKPRVLSGVQPSGQLHLGNYVGALAQWARDQQQFENFFCVVDLHALTIPEQVDPRVLHAKSREVAALYVACGIDPDECAIFIQSHVKEHAELAWILNCVTPIGWLEKMTQYKSKATTVKSIGTGLLTYPVLQAADILVYQADFVPVGEDQRQHIELARDIAQRFNNLFSEVLVAPQARLPGTGARIMALDDPTEKMSKSADASRKGQAIGLLDPPQKARKAIMSAVTDSNTEVGFDRLSPGLENLLTIYRALSGASREEVEQKFAGRRYGELKGEVADAVLATLEPIQRRYAEITGDPAYLEEILRRGAERVLPVARETLRRVKEATGLG
jgi:tryptophanyl-tRNA synthetase